MGIYDRDYNRAGYQRNYNGYNGGGGMQMRLPQITPVVKKLLLINVVVFLICIIIRPLGDFIYTWFSVDSTSLPSSLQLWRLVSYQFLHDNHNIWHIVLNMVGLYFLGPTLERYWHSKKFLIFYLLCGSVGGIFYILLSNFGIVPKGILVGASGAILGMLAACAILFPHFVVFIMFFPVPIRIAALILTFMYVVNIFTGGGNAGGDAAHIAGMAAGAGYVYLWPKLKMRYKPDFNFNSDNWHKRFDEYKKLQSEVDRILAKVGTDGINSLSRKEKKILSRATELEQKKRF